MDITKSITDRKEHRKKVLKDHQVLKVTLAPQDRKARKVQKATPALPAYKAREA